MLLISRLQRFALPLLTVALVAFTIFFAFAAVGAKSSAARSARLERDGIRVVGTVTVVLNHRRTTRIDTTPHSYSYTSDVTVGLQPPVHGHATTHLHFSHAARLVVGQPVTVLVDPQDPAYAEQPGHGTSSTQWKVLTGAAIGTGGLAIAAGVFTLRRRKRDV